MVGEQSEQGMDFSGDNSSSVLLPMLDEMFAKQAVESQQLAQADDNAANSGQQGPGAQIIQSAPDQQAQADAAQMGPPGPTQPQIPGGMPNAAPYTPNTAPGSPGPAPIAPAPPNSAAAQYNPTALSPEPMAKYIEEQSDAGIKERRDADQLARKAELEKAQVDQQVSKDMQPMLEEISKIDADVVSANDAVNNYFVHAGTQVQADTAEDLQKYKQLAEENPQDYWGHHSTLQKIAAVVGMVGAGMQGKSAAGFMENLVNQDVAAYNRRIRGVEMVHKLHKEQYDMKRQIGSDAQARIGTQKISRYQRAKSMFEAAKNKSASLEVQARYDAAIALLDTKAADDINKLNNQKIGHLATEEQNKIKMALLSLQRQKAAASPKDTSIPFRDAVPIDSNGPRGVPTNLAPKVKDKYDGIVGNIGALDSWEREVNKFMAGGQSLADLNFKTGPLNAMAQSYARKFANVGARLEGKEQELINDLSASYMDLAKGKITGAQFSDKLDVIRSQLADAGERLLTENNPNLKMAPESRVAQIHEKDRKKQEVEKQETGQIVQATQGRSKLQAHAALVMLAKNGNKEAKRMLKESDGGAWYRRLLGSFSEPSE